MLRINRLRSSSRGKDDGTPKEPPPQLPGRKPRTVPRGQNEVSNKPKAKPPPLKKTSSPQPPTKRSTFTSIDESDDAEEHSLAKSTRAVQSPAKSTRSHDKAEEDDDNGADNHDDGYETRNGSDGLDSNDGEADGEADVEDGQDDDADNNDDGYETRSGIDVVDDEEDDEEDGEAEVEDGEADEQQPTLVQDATQTRVRITKNGENKYWMKHSRLKTSQCAPTPNKQFILYLPLTPENIGAMHMITNDINLQDLANRNGGAEMYSKSMANCFNQNHRKAKSQLNRTLVLHLTKDGSPYQIARNVMCGKAGPMALVPELSHLGSIQALIDLLNSDHLYCDDKVHQLWAGLFASGNVYGCKRAVPTETLDQMVDVDYEAHARYEMISRLSCQGWKHGYTAKDLSERSQGFRKVRKLVRVDRANNLKAAESKRLFSVLDADANTARAQALGSGGLADTTDEEDDY